VYECVSMCVYGGEKTENYDSDPLSKSMKTTTTTTTTAPLFYYIYYYTPAAEKCVRIGPICVIRPKGIYKCVCVCMFVCEPPL